MKDLCFCLSQFDYHLPRQLIAQEPVYPRDVCRLLIVDRKDGRINEGIFRDILGFFAQGDVLVLNDTKVIKARLLGKTERGSKIEILLLKERQKGVWEALAKPVRRARIGEQITFDEGRIKAKIMGRDARGIISASFSPDDLYSLLDSVGKVPLPPYIKKNIDDITHYQTVYADKKGAVAAPTAGLHFTKELLSALENKGVIIVYLTLHCGLATFRPVKTSDIRDHRLQSEWVDVPFSAAKIINEAKARHNKVVAVGTTCMRALESAAVDNESHQEYVRCFCGETSLYVVPGYQFKVVDAVITNFHTPHSTNLILISAFCGYDLMEKSYEYAVQNKFRFFSFGDAMIIV